MKLTRNLILASGSPRRSQLLHDAGLDFDTLTLDIDESYPSDLKPEAVAGYLARKKGLAALEHIRKDQIVLTADTTVIVGNRLLEKPADNDEARMMLETLSGKMHKVMTGVCMVVDNSTSCFSDTTNVYIRKMNSSEIQYYIQHHKVLDKAGAYGIQDWIGLTCIERLEGSYFNVVGLPVHLVYHALRPYIIDPEQG